MGRRLVGCEVRLLGYKGETIHVMTTHLESIWDNKDVRNSQFDTIKEVISDLDNLIIGGDFNICSNKEPIEKNIRGTNLKDCWAELGCPSGTKWTYNGALNQNIKGGMKGRLDRIYYRLGFGNRLHQLRLVGLNSTNPNILEPPSDHYGLYAEFWLK